MMFNFESSAVTQLPSNSVSSQEQTVLTEMFLEARVCFLILKIHFMRWFSLYIGPVFTQSNCFMYKSNTV